MGDLLIKNQDTLEIISDNDINKIFLNINTYGNKLIIKNQKTMNEFSILNNNFRWIEINKNFFKNNKLNLHLQENKFIKIKGIKTSKNQIITGHGTIR